MKVDFACIPDPTRSRRPITLPRTSPSPTIIIKMISWGARKSTASSPSAATRAPRTKMLPTSSTATPSTGQATGEPGLVVEEGAGELDQAQAAETGSDWIQCSFHEMPIYRVRATWIKRNAAVPSVTAHLLRVPDCCVKGEQLNETRLRTNLTVKSILSRSPI